MLIAEKGAEQVVRGVDAALIRYADGNASLLGANEEQLEYIAESIGSLAQSVEIGFTELIDEARQIREGIESIDNRLARIEQILAEGFEAITESLAVLSEQLDDISEILKHQERTWSAEQYKEGMRCFKNGLVQEALAYFKKAAFGASGREGVPTEYRYHFMIGCCLLGYGALKNVELIDTSKASEHFEYAKRYLVLDQNATPDIQASVLAAAGWAAYCNGDVSLARQNYGAAWSQEKNSDIAFGLAKSHLNQDATDNARNPIRFLLTVDGANFLTKAANDPDFFKHSEYLITESEICKAHLRSYGSGNVEMVVDLWNDYESLFEKANELLGDLSGAEPWDIGDLMEWSLLPTRTLDFSHLMPSCSVHLDQVRPSARQLRQAVDSRLEREKMHLPEWRRAQKLKTRYEQLINDPRMMQKIEKYEKWETTSKGIARFFLPFMQGSKLKRGIADSKQKLKDAEQRVREAVDRKESPLKVLQNDIRLFAKKLTSTSPKVQTRVNEYNQLLQSGIDERSELWT